jgi:hypothetical protein
MRDRSTILILYRIPDRCWLARLDLKFQQADNTAKPPSFGPEVRGR